MVDSPRVGWHLVVVALGIDDAGTKRILGLADGKQHPRRESLDDLAGGFTIPEGRRRGALGQSVGASANCYQFN